MKQKQPPGADWPNRTQTANKRWQAPHVTNCAASGHNEVDDFRSLEDGFFGGREGGRDSCFISFVRSGLTPQHLGFT